MSSGDFAVPGQPFGFDLDHASFLQGVVAMTAPFPMTQVSAQKPGANLGHQSQKPGANLGNPTHS